MKICMLGFGMIAGSHLKGYRKTMQAGSEDKLVAVCDIRPERLEALQKEIAKYPDVLGGVHAYADYNEMLEKEAPDIVDICLPTYMHRDFTVELLGRGYHVQCEKPMALTAADCDDMIRAAEKSGKVLMIGMVLRFEPLYLELKKMIDDGRYGKLKSIHFERLSDYPTWGYRNWFGDMDRSGGVALDLHIHDVDMIRFLFGEPEAVSAVTVGDHNCDCITIESRFHYKDKMVSAIGDWGRAEGTPFAMYYYANFEKATVTSDTKGNITVCADGEAKPYEYERRDRMQMEAQYMESLAKGAKNEINPLWSAKKDVELVHTLLESAKREGEKITL